MQKLLTILMVLALFSIPAFAQEQQADQAGQQAEQAADQAGNAVESAGQAAEQQAEQTGKAVEQQTQETGQEVLGAEQNQQAQQDQQQMDGQVAEGVFKLSALQGTPLMNSNGDEVGEFKDALLTDDGKVSYIIAELSDVQDLQSGRYAIPASALSLQNQNMVLDMQNASQFSQVEEGQKPQDAGQYSVLLSSLMDYEVIDNQGQNVGEFEDVVVDLQSGKINYVALSFGGILGIGDEMFAVPYNDIWYNMSDRTIRVNVSEQKLEQLEGFNQDSWPTQADEKWAQRDQSQQQAQGEQNQQDQLGAEQQPADQAMEQADESAEQAGEAVESAGQAAEQQAEQTGDAVEQKTDQAQQ